MAVPALSGFVPRYVVPFLNTTVPVGPPAAPELTVAANVTACPELEGFGLDARLVVEG
jgi:hypothetical protein